METFRDSNRLVDSNLKSPGFCKLEPDVGDTEFEVEQRKLFAEETERFWRSHAACTELR